MTKYEHDFKMGPWLCYETVISFRSQSMALLQEVKTQAASEKHFVCLISQKCLPKPCPLVLIADFSCCWPPKSLAFGAGIATVDVFFAGTNLLLTTMLDFSLFLLDSRDTMEALQWLI